MNEEQNGVAASLSQRRRIRKSSGKCILKGQSGSRQGQLQVVCSVDDFSAGDAAGDFKGI